MKAAHILEPGPPENIRYGDVPTPEPTGAQVLVRVKAVSVNPIDTYIRGGMIKADLPKPFIIGCDLAGVVEKCGPEAGRFQPGTRVWGSNQGLMGRQGTFAEFAAVDEGWLYPTPEKATDEEAAAGALVGITAHLGLVSHARLQAGETIFINGGTGGVGSSVVQMAKALGAKVITTGGSAEKVAACKADLAINYHTEDVDAAIRKFAPGGVNVWLETLREPNFERTIGLLAPRGRMIVMAGREAKPIFPVGPFYVKDCSLFGFAMFNATQDEQRACANDINRWLASGQLHAADRPRAAPCRKRPKLIACKKSNTLRKAGTLAGKIVLEAISGELETLAKGWCASSTSRTRFFDCRACRLSSLKRSADNTQCLRKSSQRRCYVCLVKLDTPYVATSHRTNLARGRPVRLLRDRG